MDRTYKRLEPSCHSTPACHLPIRQQCRFGSLLRAFSSAGRATTFLGGSARLLTASGPLAALGATTRPGTTTAAPRPRGRPTTAANGHRRQTQRNQQSPKLFHRFTFPR
jgi:hypothetical protein